MFDLKDQGKPSTPGFSQIILLDERGNIVCSNDVLFDSSTLLNQSIFSYFPLLESVYKNLNILKNKKEVTLKRVETSFKDLPGFYDFTIRFTEFNGQVFLLWNIDDLTDLYSLFQKHQQSKNEIELSIENLKFLQDGAFEDYLEDKNKLLAILNTENFNYANQIQHALNYNQNAIEGFDFLITNLFKLDEDNQEHNALQDAIESFAEIIVELENLSAILKKKKTPAKSKNNIEKVFFEAIEKIESQHSKNLNVGMDLNIDVFSHSIDQPQFLTKLFETLIVNSYSDHFSSKIDLNIVAKSSKQISILVKKTFNLDQTNGLSPENIQLLSMEIYLRCSLLKELVKFYGGEIENPEGGSEHFSILINLPLQTNLGSSITDNS